MRALLFFIFLFCAFPPGACCQNHDKQLTQKRFRIGATVGGYSSHVFKHDALDLFFIDHHGPVQIIPTFGYSFGVITSFGLNKKWEIQSGINFSNLGYGLKQSRTADTWLAPFCNHKAGSLLKKACKKGASYQRNSMLFWEMPIEFRYKLGKQKVFIQSGITWRWYKKGKIVFNSHGSTGFKREKHEASFLPESNHEYFYSANISIGKSWPLKPPYSISARTAFQYLPTKFVFGNYHPGVSKTSLYTMGFFLEFYL